MKNKVLKQKGITSDDILNQITRGEKISTNLKLIEEKLSECNDNYKSKLNSTIIINNELEKESHKNINYLIEKIKDKNYRDLNQLDDLQTKLIKQLDLILFNNIDISRNIYTKIARFNDLINFSKQQKDKFEKELKKVIGENLELKEALAELEMKMRLTNYSKNNK